MATIISSQSAVDPRADLGDGVEIGPFCVVGPNVKIGDGTKLENGVTLMGRVTLGRHNHIFPGTVIGGEPQDLSYQGSDTQVIIGDHNVIRESVTINRASEKEEGLTTLGNHCYVMAGCHIGHDCRIGDRVVISNDSLLGGHVHIHDCATLSAAVGVHQFTTIGSYSFVAGISRVLHDVPPYMLVEGSPARPRCINAVALKRNQFSKDAMRSLAEAHKIIYRSKVGLDHAREMLRNKENMVPAVTHLLSFIENQQEGLHGRSRQRRSAA